MELTKVPPILAPRLIDGNKLVTLKKKKSRLLQMQLFRLVTNVLVRTGAVGQGPDWGLLVTARVRQRQRPRGHG